MMISSINELISSPLKTDQTYLAKDDYLPVKSSNTSEGRLLNSVAVIDNIKFRNVLITTAATQELRSFLIADRGCNTSTHHLFSVSFMPVKSIRLLGGGVIENE